MEEHQHSCVTRLRRRPRYPDPIAPYEGGSLDGRPPHLSYAPSSECYHTDGPQPTRTSPSELRTILTLTTSSTGLPPDDPYL